MRAGERQAGRFCALQRNRRVIRAVVTEAETRKMEQVKPDLIEWKARVFAGLSGSERGTPRGLLRWLFPDTLAQPEGAPEPT